MAKDELVFLPLGGSGEIGMNMAAYGFGPERARKWLMVDLGITFPGPHEPGADVVLPDLRFIVAEKHTLAGLVLTHAHEDHIGAVIDLWPTLQCPIYATPFTAWRSGHTDPANLGLFSGVSDELWQFLDDGCQFLDPVIQVLFIVAPAPQRARVNRLPHLL